MTVGCVDRAGFGSTEWARSAGRPGKGIGGVAVAAGSMGGEGVFASRARYPDKTLSLILEMRPQRCCQRKLFGSGFAPLLPQAPAVEVVRSYLVDGPTCKRRTSGDRRAGPDS